VAGSWHKIRLGLSWQVKSVHQGNTLLAHAQGCRTLLGPDPGLGPVRVGPLGGRLRRLTTPSIAQGTILEYFTRKMQT
jgi:hypothetical protein